MARSPGASAAALQRHPDTNRNFPELRREGSQTGPGGGSPGRALSSTGRLLERGNSPL